MGNLALYIDVAGKTFVAGPGSSAPATLPDFFQGDQIPIDLYFLEPTGNLFAPYTFKSYTTPAIRFGIGKIAAPTAGTFTITDGAQTTAAIAYNADAATVQAAIRAALTTNWSLAVVTGSAGSWVIDRGATGNVSQLTATTAALTPDSTSVISTRRNGTASLNEIQQIQLQQLAAAYQNLWTAIGSAGTVTPSTVQNGDPSAAAPVNEIQRVTFSAAPLGGTFTLTFTEGTTAPINYNATADEIAEAINEVLGADAVTIRAYILGVSFEIKWANHKNQAQLTVGASGLSWSVGFTAVVSLDTLGIDQMVGDAASVTDAIIEIEITPSGGTPETLIHQTCTVTNDLLSSATYGGTPNPVNTDTATFTADQATAVAVANTGTITNFVSWFAKLIKGITGKADWKTAPAITLEQAAAKGANTDITSLQSPVINGGLSHNSSAEALVVLGQQLVGTTGVQWIPSGGFAIKTGATGAPGDRIFIFASGGIFLGSSPVDPGANVIAAKNTSKAWVKFTDSGSVTVDKAYNVTSVTRNGAGDYTINFTNALADANYAAMISGRLVSGSTFLGMEQHDSPTRSTTALRIYTLNGAGTPTNAVVCSVVIFD